MSRRRSSAWLACAWMALAPSAVPVPHGDLHERIAALSRAIESRPTCAPLRLARAEQLLLHGDLRAASADLDRAQALDPELSGLALARARFELALGRPDAALERVERALRDDPSDVEAWGFRAELRLAAGDRAGAIESYTGAIEHAAPPAPELFLARSRLLLEVDAPDAPFRALASLDEARARLGAIPALELLAIEIELGLARFDAALTRVEALARQSPRRERWLALRGDVLLRAGRVEEARAAYRGALAVIGACSKGRGSVAAVRELAAQVELALARLDPARPAVRRTPEICEEEER